MKDVNEIEVVAETYMKDHLGNLIDKKNIREIDLERDALVKEKVNKVKQLHEEMKQLKAELFGDIEAFIELSAERYNVKLGGKKGNVTLETFDGSYQIQRQISEYLRFDEGLQAAKALIDACLREWSKDTGSELRTLVDHVFRMDKEGKLNTGAILGLRRLEIKDPQWLIAMEALSDSVKISGSRAYVRVYERKENGSYEQISLDMATV